MPKKSGSKKKSAGGSKRKAPAKPKGHIVVVHAGQQGKGFLSGLLKPLAGAAIDLIPI